MRIQGFPQWHHSACDPAVGIAIKMLSCLSIEVPKFTRYVFGVESWNNLVSTLFSFQMFPLSNCSLTARESSMRLNCFQDKDHAPVKVNLFRRAHSGRRLCSSSVRAFELWSAEWMNDPDSGGYKIISCRPSFDRLKRVHWRSASDCSLDLKHAREKIPILLSSIESGIVWNVFWESWLNSAID